MPRDKKKRYYTALALFVAAEIASWFYIRDWEYFFLLWTFISMIGVIMAFKREKWWLRFRPMRFTRQYTPEPKIKERPDVDYMTAQDQGMDIAAKTETAKKNHFALPRKPKAVRLGMLAVFAANIIGLAVVMIYLY